MAGIGTFISNVFSGQINQARVGVATEVKRGVMTGVNGMIDPASVGGPQQGIGGALPRATGAQVNGVTQQMLNQFGAGGPQAQPQSVGSFLGRAVDRLVGAVLPQPGGITDRITRGAVTNATVATGIALGAVGAQAAPHQAPVEDRVGTPVATILQRSGAVAPAAVAPVATPAGVVVTPVVSPSAMPSQPLPPASTVSTAPAIVAPPASTAFAAAAAPVEPPSMVAPAVEAPAATASRFNADTNARARAQVASMTPGGGPA